MGGLAARDTGLTSGCQTRLDCFELLPQLLFTLLGFDPSAARRGKSRPRFGELSLDTLTVGLRGIEPAFEVAGQRPPHFAIRVRRASHAALAIAREAFFERAVQFADRRVARNDRIAQ